VHVDATDIYRAQTAEAQPTAMLRQSLVFLALDFVTGRVDDRHELRAWLAKQGVTDQDLGWFHDYRIDPDVIGMNLYPLFTNKIVKRTAAGFRITMPYGEASIIDELSAMYWNRYRKPLFVSEAASKDAKRMAWMRDSFEAVRRVRSSGIPLVGYTWWPLFALIAWAYREKDLPFERYVLQLGLYDLRMEENNRLARIATPLVDAYREAVEKGAGSVGLLHRESGG
jgi:beta-glucosidase/6-phospho-beta-glucosidase/beta-galactosidase